LPRPPLRATCYASERLRARARASRRHAHAADRAGNPSPRARRRAWQFASFGEIKRALDSRIESPFLVGFLAGSSAGALATVASFPLDVLRTRRAALGLSRAEHTLAHTAQQLARTPLATMRDLYRGLSPALWQIVPWMGLNFAIYEALRGAAPTDRLERLGLYGAVSGAVSKLVVYPFDLAKKRLQMQGVQISEDHAAKGISRMPAYRGLSHCLLTVFRAEGAPGLFRGVLPSLMKAAPATSASFVTFEAMRTFLIDA
jgi:solute carrier family 25 thiamine pyrophosphate transporter 19